MSVFVGNFQKTDLWVNQQDLRHFCLIIKILSVLLRLEISPLPQPGAFVSVVQGHSRVLGCSSTW